MDTDPQLALHVPPPGAARRQGGSKLRATRRWWAALAGGGAWPHAQDYPIAPGTDRRAVRHRRTRRRLCALPRARACRRRSDRPSSSTTARRRLDHRHRRRREEPARRLHAAPDVEHAHGQRVVDTEQALPTDARLRAGRADQLLRSRARHAQRAAGLDRGASWLRGQVEARRGLTYASSGPGTPYHMAGELFKAMAGVSILHIPYRAARARAPTCSAARST